MKDTVVTNDRWGKGTLCHHGGFLTCSDRYNPGKQLTNGDDSNSEKAEIISRLNTIGQGGGLILGPTHHVQLDTPLENFWAMVNTIKETSYCDL